jgi:hypothetical protein
MIRTLESISTALANRPAATGWLTKALVSAASAVVLVACGGGGDAAPAASGGGDTVAGAQAFTSGVISGFGSIIVNGVRYDDTSAKVVDDSGHPASSVALALGANVEIDSGAVDHTTGKAKALRIRIGGGLLGPVSAIDTTASTMVVLGQTVSVTDNTVFDASLTGGLSAITPNSVIGVHGEWDGKIGAFVATRIESKTGATAYRAVGKVSDLDTTAKTFTLSGGTMVSYATSVTVPSSLANGARIGVTLETTPVSGRWVADAVYGGVHTVPDMGDVRLQGLITAWTSATSFTVGSTVVDASTASFPDGQTGVVLGAEVSVAGKTVDGVLVATEVDLGNGPKHGPRFEIHGAIASLDTTTFTFVLRGLKVSYDETQDWTGLTEAQLAAGLKVVVRGQLSADRSTVLAKSIALDH